MPLSGRQPGGMGNKISGKILGPKNFFPNTDELYFCWFSLYIVVWFNKRLESHLANLDIIQVKFLEFFKIFFSRVGLGF